MQYKVLPMVGYNVFRSKQEEAIRSVYHHKGYRRRSYPQDGAVIYEIKLIVLNTAAMLQSVAVNKKLP